MVDDAGYAEGRRRARAHYASLAQQQMVSGGLTALQQVLDEQRRDIALARAPEAAALPVLVTWVPHHGGYEVEIVDAGCWVRAVPLSFERFAGVV